MTKKNVHVSWDEFEAFVMQAVEAYPNVVGVYGPPRGGLPFAVLFSHQASVPLLQAPCAGCLIIDDICDTGATLLPQSQKGDRTIATMFYKRSASFEPDFWVHEAADDEWVVFPWEKEPE